MLFLPWRGHAAKNSEMPYQGKTCYKGSFMQSTLNVNNQFSFLFFFVVLIALLGRLYSGFQHSHWRVTETGAESSRVNEKMVCELNNHLWQLICCLRVGGRWEEGREGGGGEGAVFIATALSIKFLVRFLRRRVLETSAQQCVDIFSDGDIFHPCFYQVMGCNCLYGLIVSECMNSRCQCEHLWTAT